MSDRKRLGELNEGCWAALGLGLALGFALCVSCSPGTAPDGGSETHFLRSCEDSCPQSAVCVCGVCTTSCADAADCAQHGADASCVPVAPRIAEQRCDASAATSICDAECVEAGDCAWLGSDFGCESGYCRRETSPGGNTCEPSSVLAEDLVVLGDSLIELSAFTADLEKQALAAGSIAPDAHYRRYASARTSFLAEGPFGIGTQYTAARTERPARVVVMDGGATDMLNDACGFASTPACSAVQGAVQGAEQLFGRFAADGVEHVVYFFYPNPTDGSSLRTGLDVLRPLVQNVCGKSRVACHWLDLRPVFAGHPEYLGPDGIVFSAAGAEAAATAVFGLMSARCLAQ